MLVITPVPTSHTHFSFSIKMGSQKSQKYTLGPKGGHKYLRGKEARECLPLFVEEPGWLSRYSDWLLAGRPRGRSSSPGRGKNFLISTSSRPVLGPTEPPIQWVPRVMRPGREADHSPPTSAEVKKTWLYTSTPPYAFMV
jgi:hypothetical protein